MMYVIKQKVRTSVGKKAKFDVFHLFTNEKEMRRFLEQLKENGCKSEIEIYETIKKETIKLEEI